MSRLMKATLDNLLSEVFLVWVIFINHPLLVAPEGVKPEKGATTTFEYGLDLPVPIDDLEITEAGIKATLSFSRVPILSPDQGKGGMIIPVSSVPPKFSLVP